MPKLTVTEAEKFVPVGKSTLYSDMETGKLSFEINVRGHKVIDPAELDRVYGLRKPPDTKGTQNGNHQRDLENSGSYTGASRNGLENSGNGIGKSRKEPETVGNADESTGDVDFLAHEVERLKQKLEAAGKRESKLLERETKLEARQEKLLDMLAMEQEKTKLLMLPQGEPERVKKKGSWLGYFRRKR